MAALPGSATPSASTILAIVDAVPIVMQWPFERCMHDSAELNCSGAIRPARTSSDIFQTDVPDPRSCPSNLPLSMGPPESPIVGRSQLAAPISNAGVVLSQPISSTTPALG